MTCKGICMRHKAQKPVGTGRYVSGQKRCQICEIFIKWDYGAHAVVIDCERDHVT